VFRLAKLAPIDLLAIVLVIVGGLNWGLYAFGYNLVSILLGWMPILEKAVYVIVALAAIYLAAITTRLSKR
jgi:uncharacterized membrane protein YuzA (DUF378 family)